MNVEMATHVDATTWRNIFIARRMFKWYPDEALPAAARDTRNGDTVPILKVIKGGKADERE